MLSYLNEFKTDMEDKRDVITGLKLLREKCLKQLEAAQAPNIIDSDITDYFKLKAARLTEKINNLESELINASFDTWLIRRKINITVNARAEGLNNG